MDILVLSHMVPYPTTSGSLLRCYNLLRQVAGHHRVHLMALNQSVLLAPGAALAESVAHLKTFCEEVQVFPIPSDGSQLAYGSLLLRNLFSAEPYMLPRFYSSELEEAVIDLLSRRPIRLMLFETIAMAPYGALAPDLPQILAHQNVESELLGRRARSERHPLKRWYIGLQARKVARFERRCLESIDAHMAVSDEDRRGLVRMAPGARVEVVPNGVDLDYFRPGGDPAGKAPALVFVGGLSWYPNADAMRWLLHDIWPRIRQGRPDASLTVIGSHPPAWLEAAAARDPGHLRVTGLVPDIRPYTDDAAVFVCPFRVGGGTRLKILDAWSMRKAVVSTAIGCEGLGAEHGRELWIADDAEAFAAATLALLDDRERRIELGAAGRARVEAEYSWPHIGGKLVALCAELADEHGTVEKAMARC